MKPITRDDVLGREEYARTRADVRRRIIQLKARRRVPLGEHATLNFETRDTMLYQVHEMLHAEGSWKRPGAIEDEFEAYNPIVPAGGELSATLMLEYETEEERTVRLQELLGLDAHLWLHVRETPPVAARFDHAQVSPTRISSVQYVKWPLSPGQARLVATEGAVLRVVVDHPKLRAQAILSEETRRELAADLA
jgi:pimeloyl-ACP methyl ester carboxylesterase